MGREMKRLVLPAPPVIQDGVNPLAYMRQMHDWAQRVKGVLEDTAKINWSPCGQAILATNFTTNTVVSGTTTGTDLSNVVSSLVTILRAKGILSPTSTRN